MIRDPDRWARGARARDAEGNAVSARDPDATSWCLEGAVAICCNEYGILPPYFMLLLDSVAEDHFGFEWGAPLFNEHFTHEAVLDLLELAAQKAERETWQQ